MKPFLSNKEIKADARELFIQRMFSPIFVTVVFTILKFFISLCIPSSIPNNSKLVVLIFSEGISFIVATFFGLFQYGLASYYLNYSTNRPAGFTNLFNGFKKSPDRILLISLILTFIQFIFLLPYDIYSYLYVKSPSDREFLISLGIMLACSALSALVNLWFEPIYFILVDLPDLSAFRSLSLCFWMMKGQVMKLLGLKLSFLPLYLLSIISFGFGLLWVIPYMNISLCLFYLDLSAKKSA